MIKIRKHLAIFLVIGMLASMFLLSGRIGVEKNYKNVDITLDYESILNMAAESKEHDIDYFLKEFKKLGASSAAVSEATLSSLEEDKELKVDVQLDGYDLVVKADKQMIDFIANGFANKLGSDSFELLDEGTLRVFGSRADYIYDETIVKDSEGKYIGKKKIGVGSKREFIGLGFLKRDIDRIKASGLEVIPRPVYTSQYEGEESIAAYFEALDKSGIKPGYIMFAGEEILGGAKYASVLAKELKSRGIIAAMIESSVQREHIEQDGLPQLVQNMDYHATRVFNVWDYIQKRYDYEIPFHRNGQEVMNSIYRAVVERNIRVVFFRPFIDSQERYVTDMSIYADRFKELEDRLGSHGLKIADVKPLGLNDPSRYIKLFSALGILAAGFVLLENLINVRGRIYSMAFYALAALTAAPYALNIATDSVDKLYALMASITFPSLAMVALLNVVKKICDAKKRENLRLKDIVLEGSLILIAISLISLAGAVSEDALLSQSKYLLEMDLFRGVKLSQVGPIGITFLAYISIFGYKRSEDKKGLYWSEIKLFLSENIRVIHMAILGVIGAAAIVYIARMGHETNIEPSSLEILGRNMLEMIFQARPRTKAILLAHPALMLLIFMAYKKCCSWSLPLLALAVSIGQGNIVNTFSHLRTPIYLSVYRTAYETGIGILIGALAVAILKGVWDYVQRRKENA